MKEKNRKGDDERVWDNREEEYKKLKEERYLYPKKILVGELEHANNEGSSMTG